MDVVRNTTDANPTDQVCQLDIPHDRADTYLLRNIRRPIPHFSSLLPSPVDREHDWWAQTPDLPDHFHNFAPLAAQGKTSLQIAAAGLVDPMAIEPLFPVDLVRIWPKLLSSNFIYPRSPAEAVDSFKPPPRIRIP